MKIIALILTICFIIIACSDRENDLKISFHNNSRVINKDLDSIWRNVITKVNEENNQVIEANRSEKIIVIKGELSINDLPKYTYEEFHFHNIDYLKLYDSTVISFQDLTQNNCIVKVETRFIVLCKEEILNGKFIYNDLYVFYPKSRGVFENILLDKISY